jgi:hypothetical protein
MLHRRLRESAKGATLCAGLAILFEVPSSVDFPQQADFD